MSTRKPHNMRARLARNCRALVRTNHAAVLNIAPAGGQHLVNWKNARLIKSRPMVDAVCDFAHPWCIYISALCIDQFGQRYIKSIEVEPHGLYLAAQLTDVIETCYRQHLDEGQAARIFDAVGAWPVAAAA